MRTSRRGKTGLGALKTPLVSRRRFFAEVAASAAGMMAASLFAACSSPVDNEYTVNILDQTGFQPSSLVIPVGGTVIWKNRGVLLHTVTADPSKATTQGEAVLPSGALPFDSGDIQPGNTWSYTFDVPGKYAYFSQLDKGQNVIGSITVGD